jgi:DNA-binding FadR family transcriptional regulator
MDPNPPSTVFRATQRGHVADEVFDQLATAILRKEIGAGSALPPERVLAREFETSRIILRQAVHRLAELGLVRVRQGGATTVLDVDEVGDLRILELLYKAAPSLGSRAIDPRHVLERQLLQGFSLLDVAARCADQNELQRIDEMTASFAAGEVDEAACTAFEERFWRAVAAAGGNRIFIMEISWWYRLIHAHPRVPQRSPTPLATRVAFYRELTRRLVADEGAASFYLDGLAPVFDALRPRPGVDSTRSPSSSVKRHRSRKTATHRRASA